MSLPLQGHYRAGKYMAVSVRADSGATVTVGGSNVLPTELPLNQEQRQAVIPLLVLRGPVLQLHWQMGDTQRPVRANLHALDDNQRLVAFTGAEPALLKQLFPEHTAVAIQLDDVDPLPGPPSAYEVLDGLVLDQAEPLPQAKMAALLANGTVLAVRRDRAPDDRWPWQRLGDYWLLRPALSGPKGVVNEDAYRPTYGWAGGWPAGLRRRVVLAGAIFVLGALLLSLWRRGWLVILALSLLSVGAIAYWRHVQSPLIQVSGTVQAHSPNLTQYDRWHYQTSPDAAAYGFTFSELAHPFFFSTTQPQSMKMKLVCQSDGQPAFFDYWLPAAMRIAFRLRRLTPPQSPGPLQTPITSPLRSLARAAYLAEGQELAGQLAPASPEAWPDLVILPRLDATD